MKRVGIDLGQLRGGDEMSMPFVHPKCPGALVRVTHDELMAHQRGGELFVDDMTRVPRDGSYGDARVFCQNDVHAWKGSAGYVVYAGRCTSCERFEADNRADLRARQQLQSGKGRREAAE